MQKQTIQQKLQKIKSQTELLNLTNHKALNGHIIVVPAEIEETGVTSRAVQFEDRPEIGLVVSTSEDIEGVEEGDVIFFGKYSTVQITSEDMQFLILREEDVYCVTTPE